VLCQACARPVAIAPPVHRRVTDRRNPRRGQCGLSWVILVAPDQFFRKQGLALALRAVTIVARGQSARKRSASLRSRCCGLLKKHNGPAPAIRCVGNSRCIFPKERVARRELRKPDANPGAVRITPICAQRTSSAQ
jgi:hypothetical protein